MGFTGHRGRGMAQAGVVLCLVLHIAAPAAAMTDALDGLWRNTDPVPRGNCLNFLVKAWPYKVYRGRTSPHDCLVKAIRDYRNGDHEEAMGWIQAAFCPDRDAQQQVVREAPAVLQHLLTVYGPEVTPE